MNRKDASIILGISLKSIKRCLENGILISESYGDISEESVLRYSKELEERRKIKKPKWINHSNF